MGRSVPSCRLAASYGLRALGLVDVRDEQHVVQPRGIRVHLVGQRLRHRRVRLVEGADGQPADRQVRQPVGVEIHEPVIGRGLELRLPAFERDQLGGHEVGIAEAGIVARVDCGVADEQQEARRQLPARRARAA